MRMSRLLGAVCAYMISLGMVSMSHAAMIDINTSTSPTATGFTALNGADGSSVTIDSVTYTIFGSSGSRSRTPGDTNDLTRDFAFRDGGTVGIDISGLAAGTYQATVWSFDDDFSITPEYIGYSIGGSLTENLLSIGASQATDPATTFTFTYDGVSDLEIYARSPNTTNFKARLNGLQLEAVVPIPAAVWLFGSGLVGLV